MNTVSRGILNEHLTLIERVDSKECREKEKTKGTRDIVSRGI